MLCIVEIAMSVFGIVTLVRGKFSFTKNKVVTGLPAYAIGIILTLTLPLLLCMGFVIGLLIAINAQGRPVPPDAMLKYAWMDMVVVPIILVIVGIIVAVSPKAGPRPSGLPQEPISQLPPDIPPMGDNPYASPYMVDPDSPRPPRST
jgi:hypothetical protein